MISDIGIFFFFEQLTAKIQSAEDTVGAWRVRVFAEQDGRVQIVRVLITKFSRVFLIVQGTDIMIFIPPLVYVMLIGLVPSVQKVIINFFLYLISTKYFKLLKLA